MKLRLQKFIEQNGIIITAEDIDNFRCLPPPENYIPDAKEQALFAWVLLDYQFHYETHVSTCFKVTSRTPLGLVCRFFFPKLEVILKSFIDHNGEFRFLQLLGLEYYNMCNILLSRLLHTNSDTQVLVNSEGRNRTAYVTKYSFKRQRLDSSFVMKFGLIVKTAESVTNRPDNETISDETRGRRIINGSLFKLTKPVEVPATLACFSLLNRGKLYFLSHNAAKLRLDVICGCYKESKSYDPFDSDVYHDLEKRIDSNFVEIMISTNSLCNGESNNDAEDADQLDNEIDRTININPMIDYQKRPASMESLNFIEVKEKYHIISGKPRKDEQMQLGHPNGDKKYWAKNAQGRLACGIIYGRMLPNIRSLQTNCIDSEYYYKGLLILFKPHRHVHEIMGLGTVLPHNY
jgi:hypothetical protein